MILRRILPLVLMLLAAVGAARTASAQPADARPGPAVLAGYPVLADRTLGADVVVLATVDRVDRVEDRLAPGLAAGDRRYLVRLAVTAALKAPGAVPAKLSVLWDAPGTRRPDLLTRPVIAFLTQSNLADYRLARADGLAAWSADGEATVRAIIAEARNPALAARRVTGVAGASWTPGTEPGAGRTQFFLTTATGDPVSMLVTSRAGQPKTVTAAFGDAIDEAAQPVLRQTIAWYYLACGLPRALPEAATRGLDAPAARAVRTDYQAAMETLGACEVRPAA